MTDLDLRRLNLRQQTIWAMHAPEAFPKFDRLGIDRKDIKMSVETVIIERHMRDWEYRCNLCDDIVPRKDQTICDTCDRYAILHHFAGDIHFTIDYSRNSTARVIFYQKGKRPKVHQRLRIPLNFCRHKDMTI